MGSFVKGIVWAAKSRGEVKNRRESFDLQLYQNFPIFHWAQAASIRDRDRTCRRQEVYRNLEPKTLD